MLEELQTVWEKKSENPKYILYKNALTDGLEKLGKYYSRLDDKPSFILALGKTLIQFKCSAQINSLSLAVLHPYFKLAYIRLSWGGPVEQKKEIEAGNLDAKDWQAEAKKIVNDTVS
jgi:hypothetical protein